MMFHRTILILSMVYVVGNVVMAVSSVGRWFPEDMTSSADGSVNYQPKLWGPILGLHLIALGTGGIKPCVSSLGGDQFLKSEVQFSKCISIKLFYHCISLET